MPATIKDIKNETGLSLATISKYLNGGNVLPENKEKIDEAIRKLDYHVNDMARGLVTKKSYMIGVCARDISSIFDGSLLALIGKQLYRHGYAMTICDSADDAIKEKDNIRFLLQKNIDGLIVFSVKGNNLNELREANKSGVPVVVVDRYVPDGTLDSVTLNNLECGSRAARYLMSRGHRKIAVISAEEGITGVERTEGFVSELKKAGLAIPEEYIRSGHHSVEYGYTSLKQLAELPDRPTAVFMTNYELNLGAYMALNEMDIICPEDISVMGVDDMLLPRVVKPVLTVMKQPIRAMAEKTVELLLSRMKGDTDLPFRNVIYDAEMLPGDSVKELK